MSFKDFIKNEFPSFNGEVNFKEDVLIKDKNWELLSKKLTKTMEVRSNFIN